jgi:Protein of unknown function (DUF3426)
VQQPAPTPARPQQAAAATPPPPRPLPSVPQTESDEDDRIPEDALEFNPAAADVNQVFVEPPPNPEWTAATGTFKAIVLKSEEVTQNVGPSLPKPASPARPADPAANRPMSIGLHGGIEDDEIELDADFLSATSDMRRLKTGMTDFDADSDAGGQSKVAEEQNSGATTGLSGEPQSRPRLTPPSRPTALGMPSGLAAAQTQLAPQTAPSELPVDSRAQTTNAVRAFGLDSDLPPGRLAAQARSRIAAVSIELEPPPPRTLLSSATLWGTGCVALVLLLAAQIVNHYRNDLAATAQFNRPITALYAAFGVRLTPHWDIHAYDVRQLGASVDSASAGQIMVRASVKNGGHQAQPMPLLRVTLQDRFGNRIAARDVPPGNYLPRAIPGAAFLSAGQRIDAEMAFVDPGSNAVGFEIDACLPSPAGGIACANDPVSR